MRKTYWVYIAGSVTGTLYVGVTGNLLRRIAQHREKRVPGFTRRYNVTRLLFAESTHDVRAALAREKQIKSWRRAKKIALVESMNPERRDLADEWFVRGRKDPSLRSG